MKTTTILSLIFFMAIIPALHAQSASELLAQADELFEQKKYTEAYAVYLEIFEEHQKVSPEMLVKMAFIVEGLDDYSLALYYLNLYYRHTSDKSALRKMESLAKDHRLSGYEFNDFELLANFYHKHYTHIVYIFLALSLLWFALIYRSVRKGSNKPVGLAVGYVLILGVLFYLINFGNASSRGIITNEAFLMDGPSAAANLVDVAKRGNRIKIVDKDDVWLKIKWDNRRAFIRKNNVVTLN
jgi:hypothetical protein